MAQAEATASVESAPALLPKVNLAVFGLPSRDHDAPGKSAHKTPSKGNKKATVEPAQGVSPSAKQTAKQTTATTGSGTTKSGPAGMPSSKPLLRYFVQFGSFQDHYRAEALRSKLAQQGYAVRIPTITNKASGQRWFSVRADFEELDKATEARNAFLTQGGPRPVLGKQ